MWEDGDGLLSFQLIFVCYFDLSRSVISDRVTEMLQQHLVVSSMLLELQNNPDQLLQTKL